MKQIVLMATLGKDNVIINDLQEIKENLRSNDTYSSDLVMLNKFLEQTELNEYYSMQNINMEDKRKNIICDKLTYAKLECFYPDLLKNNNVIIFTTTTNNELLPEYIQFNNKYRAMDYFIDNSKYIYIFGNEQLYKEFFDYANYLLLTYTNLNSNNENYFPKINDLYWQTIEETTYLNNKPKKRIKYKSLNM